MDGVRVEGQNAFESGESVHFNQGSNHMTVRHFVPSASLLLLAAGSLALAAGGYLLYLRQEGRDIGLYNKIDAYALQDVGLDTYEANVALGRGEDERDYRAAAQMLRAVGADRISLLSNNPDKARQLASYGVGVDERVPTGVHLSPANERDRKSTRLNSSHRT